MNKNGKLYKLLTLFLTFLKIGALTFGGGYAMLPIIQKDVVEKKKWLSDIELMNILAISESTPGPVAINTATYVGYRICGILGSIIATLAISLPSFLIISAISYFYKYVINFAPMFAFFKGMKIGVIIVLLFTVLKLSKAIKWNPFSIILFALSFVGLITLAVLNITFSWLSIIFIFSGIIAGMSAVVINNLKLRRKN